MKSSRSFHARARAPRKTRRLFSMWVAPAGGELNPPAVRFAVPAGRRLFTSASAFPHMTTRRLKPPFSPTSNSRRCPRRRIDTRAGKHARNRGHRIHRPQRGVSHARSHRGAELVARWKIFSLQPRLDGFTNCRSRVARPQLVDMARPPKATMTMAFRPTGRCSPSATRRYRPEIAN